MSTFLWILSSGVAMSVIALIGSLTLVLRQATLERLLLPLVAFAAGSLIGGALFHLLPAAATHLPMVEASFWAGIGFLLFLGLEQLLHWRHCRRAYERRREPLTYLVLLGDGLHNLLGGLSIGGVFVMDVELGVAAWLAAAAHEIPQELGDFAVLVHGGWSKRSALLLNFASGLTFLAGGLIAYAAAQQVNVAWLVPLAAGNFLYIGAVDLVPEVNKTGSGRERLVHFGMFAAGLLLLGALARIVS